MVYCMTRVELKVKQQMVDLLGIWRDVVRRRRERLRCYYVMFISLLLL